MMVFDKSVRFLVMVVIVSSIVVLDYHHYTFVVVVVAEEQKQQQQNTYDYDFDWNHAVKQIRKQRKRWQNIGIIDYIYESQPSCFCTECYQTSKYLTVETKITMNATTKDGELYDRRRTRVVDAIFVPEKNPLGCNDTIDHPPFTSYRTIDGMFNDALEHAQEGRDANCTGEPFLIQPGDHEEEEDVIALPPSICGGFVDITFDPVLKYPLSLSLAYGPFLADAGILYTIGCMDVILFADDVDVLDIMSNYTNACSNL